MKYFLKPLVVLIVLISACNFMYADSSNLLALQVNKSAYPNWVPCSGFKELASSTSRIEALLTSKSATDRAKSAFLLGQIANPSSIKLLKTALNDSDRNVRVQAGIALALMDDISGMGVCRTALSTEPQWIRYYAIYGLWQINDNEYLRNNLNNQTDFIKTTIQSALKTKHIKYIRQKVNVPNICQFIKQRDLWEDSSWILEKEADVWWHNGDYDNAIRSLEAAMFIDPEYVKLYANTAWLEWSSGRDEDAITTLKRCITNNPIEPDAYFELGFHYYNTKRYALAEKPLMTSVSFGGDIQARKTYAHCLERLGKIQESFDEWESILKDFPYDAVVIKNHERVKNLVQKEKTTIIIEAN